MDDVVLDDAVEDVAADETEFAIDSGSSALDEAPLIGFVVRGILVGVVEVRDGDCD